MDNFSNDPTVFAGSDDLTGRSIGRFQITALLGKGGMGEVYLAEDSLLKRPVALKRVSATLRVNPHYRELLIKEAERASRLNDEHVARIHDVMEHEGEVFLVMEYVEGQSLRQRIGQPLPLSEFLNVAVQCVEALVAAYQSGIVHRDIKPENIMINTKGLVKICDFGLARHDGLAADTSMLDRTPTVAFRGTPAYMAPEALLNRSPDFRADIFSLGIVFYELLTGTHPFRETNNQVATVDRIIHAGHVPVGQIQHSIPSGISRIVDKMLRKEPDARYASPNVLLQDLLSVAKGIPVEPSVRSTKTRKQFAIGALLMALVLAVVFGLLTLNRDGPPAVGGQHRNLVVLPFRAVGDAKETRTYSDGFTETLTARLSQETGPRNLAVTPLSEVRAKRVSTADEARKQFGADLILAGTLFQSGLELRFTYSLYEVGTLRQLGTGTIATTSTNPFVLEDQVVDAVKQALGFASGQPKSRNEDRTAVPEAYDLYLQGRGHLQDPADSNRLQIAVQAFQRAKDLDPSYATAYASLGEAYWAKYQATKEAVWVGLARESCEKADELNPNSAVAKICLGNVNLGSGQFERSIGDFQRAVELDQSNDAAYLGLASGYEKIENHQAAERIFKQAIELKPNFYLGYVRLGQFYIRRGRYADAAAQFQKEITIIPGSDQAYLRIGAAYIYLNRYEDAITVLSKSIELRPTAAAYSNIGSTYLRMRRFDDAVQALEQAVKLSPRNFTVIGNLGRAYYWSSSLQNRAAGTYERAIALALEDLSINPRNSDAHMLLARYYAMSGKKTESLNHLNHAMSLRQTDAEYFSISAVVYNQFGNRQAALAALRTARKLGWSTTSINNEIEFDNLRTEPEFRKLMEE